MYINKIDSFIDDILNRLYLEVIKENSPIFIFIKDGKTNFVEIHQKINIFVQTFYDNIDFSEIKKLLSNEDNFLNVLAIIKRYLMYYILLYMGYYYTGTSREYRNNIIKYSQINENSIYHLKNFFNTENNYQLLRYYQIIKDVSHIITLSDAQKKELKGDKYKTAFAYIKSLSEEYINSYLLEIIKDEKNEENIAINIHNFLKTIVFRDIYQNQERSLIFQILNDVEEKNYEYSYIDIVVSHNVQQEYENFKNILPSVKNHDRIVHRVLNLINENNLIKPIISLEKKNNYLLEFLQVIPIVDNFLRYHRDTEKIESDNVSNLPIVNSSNSKNIKAILLYQQRKKKENIKAQIIVNKLESISDLYSKNIQTNLDNQNLVKSYFQGPYYYRKCVQTNYVEEIYVVEKMIKQGRKVIEGSEYFLELQNINNNAYFNFKNFQNYGVSIALETRKAIHALRYSNIEYQNIMPFYQVDTHIVSYNDIVPMVGLAVVPLSSYPMQCIRKTQMLNIRKIDIHYLSRGRRKTFHSENGFLCYLKILKYFFIDTIVFEEKSGLFSHQKREMQELNPHLVNRMVYWIYDMEKDIFKSDTYENTKSYNFEKNILLMNAIIYDRILTYFMEKLINLIKITYTPHQLDMLLYNFRELTNLPLPQKDIYQLIVEKYLQIKDLSPPLAEKEPSLTIPVASFFPEENIFYIKINMYNPTKIKPYVDIKEKITKAGVEKKCHHLFDLQELEKINIYQVTKYNEALTSFIEKYSKEIETTDFVCCYCGEILPIKHYVQDGTFNDETQKFVSNYTPLNTPLEEMNNYRKYKVLIEYIQGLFNRIGFITNVNLFNESNKESEMRRRGLLKNTIDIILKHNEVNLQKKVNYEERYNFFASHFSIPKSYNNMFFFDVNDTIINNRVKFNIVILYTLLIFLSDINATQIISMDFDKIGNIYVFQKYADKIYNHILLKKNINGNENVPIRQYPVLCYCLYLMSYYFILRNLWYHHVTKKKFDHAVQKIIIYSFVDLINSIILDTAEKKTEYIYNLISSKFFGQLHSTFQNPEIIEILRVKHLKYSGQPYVETTVKKIDKIYHPGEITTKILPREIILFKASPGIRIVLTDWKFYHITSGITNLTNCDSGKEIGNFHLWKYGSGIFCEHCRKSPDDLKLEENLLDFCFFYNMQKLAQKYCISGNAHIFQDIGSGKVCEICGKKSDEKYTESDLWKLEWNLQKNNEVENEEKEMTRREVERLITAADTEKQTISKKYREALQRETLAAKLGTLISKLTSILGEDTDLKLGKYPVYLNDDIFIINHNYDGRMLDNFIVYKRKDNKILFREDHPFFKTDVYYYNDGRGAGTDVYYHAISLELIGYKEKYKDYVTTNQHQLYLIIVQSIYHRFEMFGFSSNYLKIHPVNIYSSAHRSLFPRETEIGSSKIYKTLIQDHLKKLKNSFDIFISVFFKINNSLFIDEELLETSGVINEMITKYASQLQTTIPDLGKSFMDWQNLRETLIYEDINWEKEKIKVIEKIYVNYNSINHYDISGNIASYYVLSELIKILESHEENQKVILAQLIIELINYVYHLYNTDVYEKMIEYKRFDYIFNSSPYMKDLMKGERNKLFKEIPAENIEDEREKEEMEDLREEQDALDIEKDYEELEELRDEGMSYD